ncbi:hypothetical protein TWF694_009160 [Orbilia ellipsospora]|uniref:Fe2OG dioxygenase domain-containing protein n=1 Tax=Orbilia ellipsospora TaxID=2528407 RepID=A0AAV9XGU7_9PEZI
MRERLTRRSRADSDGDRRDGSRTRDSSSIRSQLKSLVLRQNPELSPSMFSHGADSEDSIVGLLKQQRIKDRGATTTPKSYTFPADNPTSPPVQDEEPSPGYFSDDLEADHEPSFNTDPELPIVKRKDLCMIPHLLTKYPAFYVTDHNLPHTPFDLAKHVLNCTDSEKESLRDPQKSTTNGYNLVRDQGREWWDYNPQSDFLGPKGDAAYEAATKEYFNTATQLLQDICKQFNIVGEVIPKEIVNDRGYSSMRYLRYNEDMLETEINKKIRKHRRGESSESVEEHIKEQESPKFTFEPHTDLDVFTLIDSTEPSGLYVWNKRGKVFPAKPVKGAVLILAGDLMPCYTAIKGKSPLFDGKDAVSDRTVLPTAHTVWVPKGAGDRYSVEVSLRPKRNAVLWERTINIGSKEVMENTTFWWLATEKSRVDGRKCFMVDKAPEKKLEAERPAGAPGEKSVLLLGAVMTGPTSKFSW